ncbi:MAG TPA: hypothetical protein VFX38_05440, partial [Gammaproteobacteria bacterium]|nr:hypothetical protein [Gammaproteobacteria bacterium]
KDYRADQAQNLYYNLGDKLANVAFEHPDSLEPVAKALGLEVQTIAGVTRDQGKDVAGKEAIRAAAFSSQVLKDHQNSEPVKLGKDDAVVLRVAKETPAHPRPLAKVHDDIAKTIEGNRAQAAAKAAASGAVKDLQAGHEAGAVASALGTKLQGPSSVARSDPKVPAAILEAAFSTPPRADGKSRFGTAALTNGDQAVYAMLGVVPQTSANKEQAAMVQLYGRQLAQINANEAYDSYLAWLRARADIKIEKQNIP